MRKTFLLIVLLAAGVALVPFEGHARGGIKWRGSGGWGAGMPYCRIYNTSTALTLKGEVVSVDKFVPMKGMSDGLHLTLKTKEGTIPVHIGPVWFLERQDFPIEAGDTIEADGSKVDFEGKPALIASEIRKGDKSLALRDPSGLPVWSGWRRR